ncbi:hypothetical protein ANN_24390 [Periplaneta americana]|uniref:Uncharacterized protein n=1 Tax=Periplaneta americana TaxID=6978 RepID=A0ABQ8S3B5_PERAM|nr:hypothetical protein ANN_24390 [Periplaneta americana]
MPRLEMNNDRESRTAGACKAEDPHDSVVYAASLTWDCLLLRWAGHVARMGESRNAYRVLVRRPEGKRPLGRPRRRWEDNIKMDLREVGYDDREWINLAQDRVQWRAYLKAAMNLRHCEYRQGEQGDYKENKGKVNITRGRIGGKCECKDNKENNTRTRGIQEEEEYKENKGHKGNTRRTRGIQGEQEGE